MHGDFIAETYYYQDYSSPSKKTESNTCSRISGMSFLFDYLFKVLSKYLFNIHNGKNNNILLLLRRVIAFTIY